MTREPDWTSLRVFLTALELGSIAKAADRCGIAYSAAARRVQILEADAGAPLLERRPRGVTATAAGESFARRARALIDMTRELETEMRAFASGGAGTARLLATPSALGGHDLPARLADFAARHPGVVIDLRERMSLAVLQEVYDGRADLGLITSNAALPAGLEAAPWRQDRLVVALAPSHPLASRARAAFDEILGHPLVEVLEFSAVALLLAQAAERLGRRPAYRFRVSSMDAARRLAASGLAAAIMPNGMVEPYADRLQLHLVEIAEPWAQRQLRLVSRAVATLPAAARLLRDALLAP